MQTILSEVLTENDVALRFPSVFARAPMAVRKWCSIALKASLAPVLLLTPYAWQSVILSMLELQPDSRKILWLWDPVGNTGKSYLARHLVRHRDAFYCTGGKHTDVFHAYGGQSIAIFDFPRDSEEFVCYGVIEALKNGIFFSPKYTSEVRQFDIPHIIVFSNFLPTLSKFSDDRWGLFKILDLQLQLYHGDYPTGYFAHMLQMLDEIN